MKEKRETHLMTQEQKFCRSRWTRRPIVRALDLNGGKLTIEVADFIGKMHAEDYLDWEASLENYFEWNPWLKRRNCCLSSLYWKVLHFNVGRELESKGLDKVSEISIHGNIEGKAAKAILTGWLCHRFIWEVPHIKAMKDVNWRVHL